MSPRATALTLLLLLSSISFGAATSVASQDPYITGKDPDVIVPHPRKIIVLQLYGDHVDGGVGGKVDWTQYWHIWIRSVSAGGVAGPWTHCVRENGCVMSHFSSSSMTLEIVSTNWASEEGSEFQMHYFMGLADEGLDDPAHNRFSTFLTAWSNTVSWKVTSVPQGIRYVPPRAPAGPVRKAAPPLTERDIAGAPGASADAPRPVATGDACKSGFVWREASAADHVCVSPSARDRTRDENAAASSHVDPNAHGPGPANCLVGYVWREAYPGDVVCVTPAVREIVRRENADGPSHLAGG